MAMVLTIFYTLSVTHVYSPSEIVKIIVSSITKNKIGDLADSGKYWTIPLATVLSKIFDTMFATQINFVAVNLNSNLFYRQRELCRKSTTRYYAHR